MATAISVHPATLLRKLRAGKAGKYHTFRKNARLVRWREGSNAAADVEIARDAVTIQSGEVWLALDGPKAVVPVVVISPCAHIANGLRPENDCLKPHLLKDCESLGLHVFGKETPTGTTYKGTGKDFTRRPRLLLHKVEASDFSADGVRADETLTLSKAATAKLKALAADKRMEQLWQTISPGKKAAATGSDGSSQPPITDEMRAAVAKALAVAAAAQQAAAAILPGGQQ